MQNMQSFVSWFLNELPDFLMSEPICYIVGFAFLGLAIYMMKKIITLH